MVCDLCRSDWRWIRYYDVRERYCGNAVVDFLKERPYENRMTGELVPLSHQALAKDGRFFQLYYDVLQNQIPGLNIQSLDIVQAPRMPAFDEAYMRAFHPNDSSELALCSRLWKLTNTRYLIGEASALPDLNSRIDPAGGFKIQVRYNQVLKPGLSQGYGAEDLTWTADANGQYAVFELTNVLPRAKLYSNWKVAASDSAALIELASPQFDFYKTVLIAAETPVAAAVVHPETDPGTVLITDYKPRHITLSASAKTASVLLLNDRTAPDWKVWVDGKLAEVLRCNYIMRGVALSPGDHTVEFRYQPPLKTFYASLCGWAAGILIAGFLVFWNRSVQSSRETA